MKRTAAGAVTPVNPTTYIVQATNLTSREIYLYPDGKQESVLLGNVHHGSVLFVHSSFLLRIDWLAATQAAI